MIGKAIAWFFIVWRDAWARGLIAIRVTPNTLTAIGMGLTLAVGACYALGADTPFAWSLNPSGPSAYMLLAAALLFLASACDMLDGAVARIGGKATRFGAFLDSTMDRFSDFAVYAGIAIFYARHWPGKDANPTFVVLSMIAFFGSFMISYTRARAEDLIDACRVGYWQRGERSAAILIATCAHNIPALVLQQAASPLLTALRRILYTRAILQGRTPVTDPREGPLWMKLCLWRYPRMSWPYDLITGLNIAWLIFAPVRAFDPISGDWKLFTFL